VNSQYRPPSLPPSLPPSDPTLKSKELPSSGTLGVVPPSIRSMTLPSLWDKLQDEEGGMGGGMVGDSIRMKRQRGNKGEVSEEGGREGREGGREA